MNIDLVCSLETRMRLDLEGHVSGFTYMHGGAMAHRPGWPRFESSSRQPMPVRMAWRLLIRHPQKLVMG